MMNRSRYLAGVLTLGLLLAACSEGPTLQLPETAESTREPVAGAAIGSRRGTDLVCVTRVARASGPYRWTAATTAVRFPAAELDPAGRTIDYRYRGYTPANRVVAAVDCAIPATEAAIQRMNRRLKVEQWHRVGSGSPSDGARLSMGTASYDDLGSEGSTVALKPVSGTAKWCGVGYIGTYPNCWSITSGTVTGGEPDSGDGWDWGGTGEEGEGTEPDNAAAFSEGPIAWAICVLGLVGSTMSVMDVADKFQAWHAAWQDALGAHALWQATVQNNADPVTQQLYEYQYRQARQRQEDAKGDVQSATNMSYVGLGLAALGCGAVALAPTP